MTGTIYDDDADKQDADDIIANITMEIPINLGQKITLHEKR